MFRISSDIRQELVENLRNSKEYRDAFVEERIFARLPLRLRNMRGKMTQKEMALAMDKAQTWISKLEDPNYGRFTIATLLELAHFHDVGLEVDFVPFSRLLDEVIHPEIGPVESFQQEENTLAAAQKSEQENTAGANENVPANQNQTASKGNEASQREQDEAEAGNSSKPITAVPVDKNRAA